MQYYINGQSYFYSNDIRDHDKSRHSFNELAFKTFGLSFETWYQNGYWSDRYIPHALLDGETVVANISVNLIDFVWQKQNKRYIQLGTVMTDRQYRNKGLVRWLMNKVLEQWKNQCGAMFLYANDSVLDLYPKFGFLKAEEHQFELPVHKYLSRTRLLDMSNSQDRDLLLSLYNASNPFSALTVINNPGLLMFYCTQFLRDNIYYIEDCNAIVIAQPNGTNMLCYDVFCSGSNDLEEILCIAAQEQTDTVQLGFTPIQKYQQNIKHYHEENATLFMLKDKDNIFSNNQLMFPLLSHA